MLTIEDNKIILTRGDTAYINVKIDSDITLNGTITLTVRPSVAGEVVIEKTINVGEAFVIEPDDTKDLAYGKYVYDVQVDTTAGEVFTVIEKSGFVLKEEITR